jgi:hypothetical protein
MSELSLAAGLLMSLEALLLVTLGGCTVGLICLAVVRWWDCHKKATALPPRRPDKGFVSTFKASWIYR